jgi:hypothetical protein
MENRQIPHIANLLMVEGEQCDYFPNSILTFHMGQQKKPIGLFGYYQNFLFKCDKFMLYE